VTKDSDFKKQIRQLMAETGESYTVCRDALLRERHLRRLDEALCELQMGLIDRLPVDCTFREWATSADGLMTNAWQVSLDDLRVDFRAGPNQGGFSLGGRTWGRAKAGDVPRLVRVFISFAENEFSAASWDYSMVGDWHVVTARTTRRVRAVAGLRDHGDRIETGWFLPPTETKLAPALAFLCRSRLAHRLDELDELLRHEAGVDSSVRQLLARALEADESLMEAFEFEGEIDAGRVQAMHDALQPLEDVAERAHRQRLTSSREAPM